jgi:hypothetical protein
MATCCSGMVLDIIVIACGYGYYFIFKKIFSKTESLVFVTIFFLMISHYLDEFYNPIGGLLTMPFLYSFAYQYLLHQKLKDG